MTLDDMKKVFAVQLDSQNLDRAGTITFAAEIIANLSQKLGEAEARASNAEIREKYSRDTAEFYKNSCDEAYELGLIVLENWKQCMTSMQEELPKLLVNVEQESATLERQRRAVLNAERMLSNDKSGKQAAKQEIRERWFDWHTENQKKYSDNTDFSEAMQKEYNKVLNSVVQISQWCGEWSKEVAYHYWEKAQPHPVTDKQKETFAKALKTLIKTVRPHDVIRWCNEFEKPSNSAS